jgi:hypothetical protein
VQEVARKLVDAGVSSRDDVGHVAERRAVRAAEEGVDGVHGLGWVTFEYFRLLCGAETAKPDIMIHRWLAEALGHQSMVRRRSR